MMGLDKLKPWQEKALRDMQERLMNPPHVTSWPRQSGKMSMMLDAMRRSMPPEKFNEMMFGNFNPKVLQEIPNMTKRLSDSMERAMLKPAKTSTHFDGLATPDKLSPSGRVFFGVDPASPKGDSSAVVTCKVSKDGRYIQPIFHFTTGDANALSLNQTERRFTTMTNDNEAQGAVGSIFMKAPKPLEKMTKAELIAKIGEMAKERADFGNTWCKTDLERQNEKRRADRAEDDLADAKRHINSLNTIVAKLEGYVERVTQMDNAQFRLDRDHNVPGDKVDTRAPMPFGVPGRY
jgi:hypothetical protein